MKKGSNAIMAMVLISLALFLGGCKKSTSSNNNNNNNPVSDLVASFTNTNSATGASTVYSFTYDSQNRLTGEQVSDGTEPISYSYSAGMVTKIQGTTTTVFTLNNAGLAASDNQGNTYSYDANGYLLNISNPNGTGTVNTVSNGNVVNSVQTTTSGTTTYAFTFAGNPNSLKFGNGFLGAPNSNIPNSESINGFKYNISYTYDSHGRVATEKIVSGTTTLTRNYTYIN